MSTTAPKPPTKRLLFCFGLATGITTGMWAIIGVGHLVFSGIPAYRMPWYIGAGLIGIALSSHLGTQYVVQKHRRDAWWDGYAAGDEPGAEVIQLSEVRSNDGNKRKFQNGSSS